MLNRTEKKITSDEQAVSEVMGQVLLVGIAVIMLSSLSVFVFSQDGPADIPHTDVLEIMDTSTDTICLKHGGGEPIRAEDAEIILNINGKKYVYTSSQIYKSLGNRSVWDVGDTIEINTMSTWTVDLKNRDEVELYLVDTPSKELIRKSSLTTEFQKRAGLATWLTPMGEISDTSTGYGDNKQAHASDSNTEDAKGDDNENKNCTTHYPPENATNPGIYQEFDFGFNPIAYGVRPDDTFCNVTLVISYYCHDSSIKEIKLKFYDIDEYGNEKWVYSEPIYNPVTDNAANSNFLFKSINLTDHINTYDDLANFKVRIEASTTANPSAKKQISIDYMALWVEQTSIESE
ncbi:hypothetical protein MSLAZ_0103 [Methanosarcina lacustris Z-7289]|uniref:Archaeal Type IV pilin N-terminal domain-containing protein n=1 Tax=Methanosarcina lacustris Z-7289 TaxID=1434111 RepID=A0A0E3RYR2_9EURY|nr:type IV pilin N-terminal domain-containing protein [Methanosarcina lacustris]AKB73364.1 hypothetical protein MSLAZ_0103 [Methanosarcina lacustris Z-7289]